MNHQLVVEGKEIKCEVCGWTWTREPRTDCPGVKRYAWGAWPKTLLTKKQLSEAGYQTGKKLPAPAGVVYREKSPGGYMWLYDPNHAIKKNVLSEVKKNALEKAREKAKQGWTCVRCGDTLRYYMEHGGVCRACRRLIQKEWLQEAESEEQ